MFIYTLKQLCGKYYVGKTSNPKVRIQKHFMGHGPNWTKKYKPTQLIYLQDMIDPMDEEVQTFKMMRIHGVNNVRGGSFPHTNLLERELKFLNKIIHSSQDCCFICGSNEHFANSCPNTSYK